MFYSCSCILVICPQQVNFVYAVLLNYVCVIRMYLNPDEAIDGETFLALTYEEIKKITDKLGLIKKLQRLQTLKEVCFDYNPTCITVYIENTRYSSYVLFCNTTVNSQ